MARDHKLNCLGRDMRQVNFQPFFATLDELFEFADEHKHHFFDLVDRVGTATHGTCARPPLKGKERSSIVRVLFLPVSRLSEFLKS